MLLGQKYDAAVERPLVATQKQEIHVAPVESKIKRPTKEFDVSERGPVQMNGDLGKLCYQNVFDQF